MQKLDYLRRERDLIVRMEEQNNTLYWSVIAHNSLSRMLYEAEHKSRLKHLDEEIKQAEIEAFEEQAREVREATLKEISDAGSQARKEFETAFAKGFNGKEWWNEAFAGRATV